jgi:Sec-independent protein translocase protein TatA
VNIALFLIPLIVIVFIAVFRGRLPHVARSLHAAQHEYRHGAQPPASKSGGKTPKA